MVNKGRWRRNGEFSIHHHSLLSTHSNRLGWPLGFVGWLYWYGGCNPSHVMFQAGWFHLRNPCFPRRIELAQIHKTGSLMGIQWYSYRGSTIDPYIPASKTGIYSKITNLSFWHYFIVTGIRWNIWKTLDISGLSWRMLDRIRTVWWERARATNTLDKRRQANKQMMKIYEYKYIST